MKLMLSIGIVGLPNVGKSTLFNALLKRQAALVANYPFATIEPNVGVVDVPDKRLEKLAEIVKAEHVKKIVPAVVKFYDIAGLVQGAHKGEGLGNEFLGHIRECDAIVQVVRDFTDENVVRAGSLDPKSDIETVNIELVLADLATLQKRMGKPEKDLKKDRLYKLLFTAFNENKLASELKFSDEESEHLKDMNLLTLKPIVYIFNVDEDKLNTTDAQKYGLPEDSCLGISAKIESELCSLSDEDRNLYMKDLGMEESGLDKIIRKGYEILGLQTFFTNGTKEIRAWTVKKGTKAPEASGKVHTDFERGFISAEVISFDDLVAAGSIKGAKERGLLRLEGKNYVIQDGDVIEFHFSV